MLFEIFELLNSTVPHVHIAGISAVIAAVAAAASSAIVAGSSAAAWAGVSAALSLASSAILAARADGPGGKAGGRITSVPIRNRSSGLKKNIKSSSTPRRLIYGRSRVGGPILFAESTGNANQFLHLVIAHASHKCQSIESVYLNDKKLSLDSDGFDTATEFGSNVRVKKHLGSESQNVDSDLKSEVSKWDSDHRLRGICYTYTRLEWDHEVWGGIGLPEITAVVKGKQDVFDPRDDTKKYTENPALCISDYLTHSKLGIGISGDEINSASVKVAANECDETVTNEDNSTENRYTLNGSIQTNEKYREVIARMASSMAGQVVYSKGKFHIQAGATSIEGTEYDESDLISSLSVQTQLPIDQVFNSVRTSFVSSSQNYTSKDIEPVQEEEYIKKDGEEKWKETSLPFTKSHTMAKRISRIRLRKVRNPITIEADFMLKAYKNQVGDVVYITNDRMGWDKKQFEITEWRLENKSDDQGETLSVHMKMRERPNSVYDNQQEPLDSSTGDITLRTPNNISAPTGFTVTNNTITLEDGSTNPRFVLSWDDAPDSFVNSGGLVEIQKKLSSKSAWAQNVAVLDADTTQKTVQSDIIGGENYDFRIRFTNIEGSASPWTSNNDNASSGSTDGPLDITSVSAFQEGEFIEVNYDGVSDADRKNYEIWIADDSSFDEGTASKLDEHDSTIYQISNTRLIGGLGYSGDVTFGVKAVDRSGNKSSTWTTDTVNINVGYNVENVVAVDAISPGSEETYSLSNNYLAGCADLITARPYASDDKRRPIRITEYVTNNANEITDIKVKNYYDGDFNGDSPRDAYISLYMFGILS